MERKNALICSMGFLRLRFGMKRNRNYSSEEIAWGKTILFMRKGTAGSIFGSELKVILAHPDVKTEIDREGLSEVFGVGHIPEARFRCIS